MPGSLYYLPSTIGKTTNLGLYKGTLYDVLDIDSGGTGNATVNATGFNIVCGYLPNTELKFTHGAWFGMLDDGNSFEIQSTLPGVISTAFLGEVTLRNSVIFYSTIPILDSTGSPGPMVTLDPPMNFSVSAIQIFECSQTLISQAAVVDAQSRQLLSVEPGIEKSTSSWGPYAGPPQRTTFSDTNPLVYAWGNVYSSMPASQFPRDSNDIPSDTQFVSVADLYLIQNLNLRPVNDAPANVTLHELENALSVVVSSMFWTVGHIPPTQGQIAQSSDKCDGGKDIYAGTLSIIALSAGLVESAALLVLSLPSSLFNGSAKKDSDLSIDGTGILHAIWLYRNHPELETLLEHVEHPTHDNLRQAGMVRTRLTTGQACLDAPPASTPSRLFWIPIPILTRHLTHLVLEPVHPGMRPLYVAHGRNVRGRSRPANSHPALIFPARCAISSPPYPPSSTRSNTHFFSAVVSAPPSSLPQNSAQPSTHAFQHDSLPPSRPPVLERGTPCRGFSLPNVIANFASPHPSLETRRLLLFAIVAIAICHNRDLSSAPPRRAVPASHPAAHPLMPLPPGRAHPSPRVTYIWSVGILERRGVMIAVTQV
ncbi:hypothetical protein DFH09DRAFT_1320128 [Mycena vulgaris]|nr:hypothetical protein DFH09DRAFT_1320128 [Mycena vulgaris]